MQGSVRVSGNKKNNHYNFLNLNNLLKLTIVSLLNRLLRALLDEHVRASVWPSVPEDDRIRRQLQSIRGPKLTHLGDPRRGELHLLGALLLQRTQQLRRWHRRLRNLDALLAGGGGCGSLLLR